MTGESFALRFQRTRSRYGSLVFGLDPSYETLQRWGLGDSSAGLDQFVDITLEAALGTVGIIKPQTAFYERHGVAGIQSLERLVSSARERGLLVVLDAKRGDVGSTNEAYASAYLGDAAPIQVDALTVTPYLGLDALRPFFDRAHEAHAGLFIVTRSSNPEGRGLQEARERDGMSVEQRLIADLGVLNEKSAPEAVGPFGAVFGAAHGKARGIDLRDMGGLFLCPGLGVQGTTPFEIAQCFESCPERVLPSASRLLLNAGPDVARLRAAIRRLAEEVSAALGAPA